METFFGLHGAGYIERVGTGTLDMIARCREAGLDAPDFRQYGDMFIQIIRRSVLRKTAQATAQDNELSNKELSDLAAAFGLPAAQATAQVAAQVVKILQAVVDPVGRNLLQQASKLTSLKYLLFPTRQMKNEIFICRHESKSGNFLFLRIV